MHYRTASLNLWLELVDLVQKSLGVVWGVVLDNLWWVAVVDLLDEFAKLAADGLVELLEELQTTVLDEGTASFEVVGKHRSELLENVLLHLDRSILKQRLQSLKMSALGKHSLQGALGLGLEVLRAIGVRHACEKVAKHVTLSQSTGVVGSMPTNLAKRPSAGSLDVVFRLTGQCIAERSDTLGYNDSKSKSFRESGNVTNGHDARQLSVALYFADIVDQGSGTTGVDDELGKFWSVLGNFADASCSILADKSIVVLEAIEDVGENFGLDNNFSKINRVLGNLSEAAANLSLQLGVGMLNQGSKVRNGTGIDNSLRKLGRVLGNVT